MSFVGRIYCVIIPHKFKAPEQAKFKWSCQSMCTMHMKCAGSGGNFGNYRRSEIDSGAFCAGLHPILDLIYTRITVQDSKPVDDTTDDLLSLARCSESPRYYCTLMTFSAMPYSTDCSPQGAFFFFGLSENVVWSKPDWQDRLRRH